MHKLFTLALLSSALAMGPVVHSQTNLPAYKVNQNKNWIFGKKLRYNFNSGSPVLGTSKNSTFNGSSSMSDDSGQLLFYANRDTIWDKTGIVMPSAAGGLTNDPIPGSPMYPTTSQVSSRIAPSLENPNQYYVFSQTSFWTDTAYTYWPSTGGNDPAGGRLFYSVVDMTLNGGMGDIVPGKKKIQLDSMLLDRAAVVKGSNCNLWVLTIPKGAVAIHAFEITSNGINPTPVISPLNPQIGAVGVSIALLLGEGVTFFGQMLASPDNTKLAISMGGFALDNYTNPPLTFFWIGGGFMLLDFDNATGVVSNQRNITPVGNLGYAYAQFTSDLCFSPDNTKLYTSHGYAGLPGRGLDQYDITGGTAAAILASRVSIDQGHTAWATGLRLGPDDKIYVSGNYTGSGNTFHRIEFPNLSGAAATFTLNAITLPPGDSCRLGFGEVTVDRPPVTHSYATHNQFLCAEDPSLTLNVPYNFDYKYQWSNGVDTNENTITQPGTYWVEYGTYCERYSDTFKILPLDLSPNFGPDRVVCGDVDPPIVLQANNIPGASYEWQNGSSASSFTVTDSGTYYVTIRKAQCVGTDTIKITSYNVFQDIGNDTVVCENTPFHIELGASVPAGASALWSTGETTDSIQVTQPGTYTVTVSQDICSSSDSVSITTEMCNCITFMPNAFSPNGDGLNDVFVPQFETGCEITGYTLQVFNRYGQKIFETIKPGAGWDGMHNGTPVDPGTYMFTISYDKGTQHHAYVLKGDLTLIR